MQPTNNSLFAPGSYTITANAVDQVGLNLTALALYMDGSMVATNAAGSTSNSISLTTNFNAGTHSIYAVAADLNGSTNSATNTVTVAVLTQPTVYFTNYNGYAINSSIYQDGMALIAVASSPLRAITNVQFFDNGISLGNGTTAAFAITNWYAANWQNASVGSHTITAVAKDTLGIANTSTLTVAASPGFNNVTGALISMQSGTYWSYWTCPSRSSTPYSSKVADVFEYSSWNYWIYGNPSGGTFPEITQGGQNENPGASGSGSGEGDALIAFTAPSAGNLNICGTTAITQAGSAGVLFRIWNGSTIIFPTSGSGWATNFEGANLLVNATASVSAGSMIQFQFSGNDTTGNYDSFSLPVTLSYTSGTNSYSASQPTVTVTTPPSGVTNLPVGRATNITITASDRNSGGLIEAITVTVDGTTLASPVYNTGAIGSFSGSTSVVWTPSSAGNHTLTAIAYDNYGQSNTNSLTATAVVFNPPNIVVTPATETVASGSYTITGTATDKMGTNITAMALYLDSSQVATSSNSPITYTASLSAGTHYIYGSATDWYGTTNSATNTLTVQTPPTAYFTNYKGQSLYTSIYQDGTPLVAVASGAGGHTISSVNFYDSGNLLGGGSTNAFGSYSGSANWYAYNWQSASVGSHMLTAVATDSAGLTNTATLSVTASPGFNNKYGAPVNSQNGTYWSYWTCQSAGSTSTKVALYWEDEPGSPGTWGYGTTASWGIPWMSVGPFCNPGATGTPSMPDSSGVGDALLGFNCPSTGNVNINGDVQLASSSSVGICWRILNGTTQLYPASGWITNSANQTIDVNYSTSVTAGNTIFVQTSCVNNNANSDWVYYPMTITYTSGTNSYNNSPSVSLTAPAGNTNIALGSPVTLTATATSQNPGGTITSVVFLNGSTVIDSNTTPTGSTYTYSWTGIPAGTNTVSAKAYDSYGYAAQTAGETVTATLYPPTVSITSLTNGSYVEFGTATTITATASSQDPGVTITNVGIVVNGTTITNIAASPYTTTWTAGIASNYVQGIATDSNGLKNTNSIYITSDIESGLVDYYLFDPDIAGNSDDTGSGGLGGLRTLYPMPTTNIYVTPGQGTSPTNHCVSLNGTTQYEWTGANDSYPFGTGSFTIDMWFKTTDTTVSTHRMFGQSLVNGTLWLSLYNSKPVFLAEDSTGVIWANSVTPSATYADGNGHNFTCVIDQGTKSYQCYIDGTLFSSATGISTSGGFSGNGSTWLGVDVSMTDYFKGSLDSLRVYDVALSQGQVQAIYSYFSYK
jgi:hypothetical protein